MDTVETARVQTVELQVGDADTVAHLRVVWQGRTTAHERRFELNMQQLADLAMVSTALISGEVAAHATQAPSNPG